MGLKFRTFKVIEKIKICDLHYNRLKTIKQGIRNEPKTPQKQIWHFATPKNYPQNNPKRQIIFSIATHTRIKIPRVAKTS